MLSLSPVSTWELLLELGFTADPKVHTNLMPGLTFDFGTFKLAAFRLINLSFQNVVSLSGVLANSRTISQIQFEMPSQVDSREQGIAWLVFHLDQADRGSIFVPIKPTAWIDVGRANYGLLPWERARVAREQDRIASASRPRCSIRRDWARVAFKTLAEHIASAADNALVTIGFDGDVLTIRCNGGVSALPAEGNAWPQAYSIKTEKLRQLPKRLLSDPIEILIYAGTLTLGNCRYDGVIIDNAEEEEMIRRESSIKMQPLPEEQQSLRASAPLPNEKSPEG